MRGGFARASAFVGLAILLTACGNGTSGEPVSAEPVTVQIAMTDVTNASAGFTKHDLAIVAGVYTELVDVKNATEADPGIAVGATDLVSPGESASLVVTFDEPGEYLYYCTVLGHFAVGMRGTITVEG